MAAYVPWMCTEGRCTCICTPTPRGRGAQPISLMHEVWVTIVWIYLVLVHVIPIYIPLAFPEGTLASEDEDEDGPARYLHVHVHWLPWYEPKHHSASTLLGQSSYCARVCSGCTYRPSANLINASSRVTSTSIHCFSHNLKNPMQFKVSIDSEHMQPEPLDRPEPRRQCPSTRRQQARAPILHFEFDFLIPSLLQCGACSSLHWQASIGGHFALLF